MFSKSHLIGVPRYGANRFPIQVIQCQALLLGLDVPHGHKACVGTGDQDMRHLLVPVQTLDVVCSGGSVSETDWVGSVVQIS